MSPHCRFFIAAIAIAALLAQSAVHAEQAEALPSWTRYESPCWTTDNPSLATSPWCQWITSERIVVTPVPCLRDGQPAYLTGPISLRWANAITADDGTRWVPSYLSGWDRSGCWIPADTVWALDHP